ncbi:agamous-like MADS-box protein AGL17 [Lycium barbarum]|uniref:agamous-like MADS-box protein AGL17 n=1 Tax=Lycium barbarum TaxID=112863 RepID=UPI00293EC5E4|nr:agamous-like MADS-box protein AGL17 [Lycium barbarum]
MGRSKINMERIQDHKNRKSTFLKRKAGLIKKISELSILCDIKACMIIYDSHQGNNQVISQHDEIWPNDPNEVQELINLYKNQPLESRSKRAKSLSSFFENQKRKAEIQMGKLKKKIKAEKYPNWDSRFDYLSKEELRNLVGVLEEKINTAKRKSEFLKSMNLQVSIGSYLSHQEIWDYPELMNDSMNHSVGSSLSHQEIWDYPELMNDNMNHSIGSSVSHQEIWDYPELMNNNLNQSTPWPVSYVNPFIDISNNFFQEFTSDFQVNIPSGVNPRGAGMDNRLRTVDDYQFGNADSMKTEAKNWLANNGIGSSSTMQPMPMDPFIYSGSTHMPYGFQ